MCACDVFGGGGGGGVTHPFLSSTDHQEKKKIIYVAFQPLPTHAGARKIIMKH